MEVQPRPGAFQLTSLELKTPHVAERLTGIIRQNASPGVTTSQNDCVENRFRTARLAGLGQASRLIGIEWLDFLPKPDTFRYVREENAFRRRSLRFVQSSMKRRTCQPIRKRSVT